ncbi:hypothetical protein FB192DRAFT_1359688 [Mucor lusitanicus]|uniref:Uncharacterized protein n=1 Tax=Mucor circinelloides f. lusitanicus TaxID=29924 RepID=A0A8H4F5Z8_MUCCL|nr:hypothetical protein FB192DRAFT_1359688 [Mucor lusitanicus]
MTFVSENKNNQANNSNINTSNASSSNDASTSANTKPSSSPVSPPSYVSAVSSPSSSSSESLQATVKHVREQSIAAALDLSDKIDSLKQENEALNAHIVALQNQLATEKSEADNFSHTLANRIDILERYIQNDAKFEDKKKREVQEVQVMAQKNTELINERISTVEDQLTKSFQEFEDRRTKELQLFTDTFKSLRQRCDELKVELVQQIQLTAKQAMDTATNTATIQETLASNTLADLGKTVRDAMELCNSKLQKVATESDTLQAVVEGTGEDIKILHERVVGLETEFDDMREEIRSDLSEMNGALGAMEVDVHNMKRELHARFAPEQEKTDAANNDDDNNIF